MLAQPYCRVSENDKGQDPLRQMDVIEPWAKREGYGLLPPVIDEGTSGMKTSPFKRPKFIEAVRLAGKHRADCILIESIDRMTREGIEMWYRAAFRLEDEYGLRIHWADMPLAMQEGMAGSIILSVRAGLAHEESRRMSERIRSGMHRKMAQGKKMGRPAKPIPLDEVLYAIQLRKKGKGWDTVAKEVNRKRGVFDLADAKARKNRGTSGPSLRRAVLAYEEGKDALQNPNPTKVPSDMVGGES